MSWVFAFRGRSGKVYEFQKVEGPSAWPDAAGVALSAVVDSFGWRIIAIAEISGRKRDAHLARSLAEARRHGADVVLVASCADGPARRAMVADLEAGLSPVLPTAPARDGLMLCQAA